MPKEDPFESIRKVFGESGELDDEQRRILIYQAPFSYPSGSLRRAAGITSAV